MHPPARSIPSINSTRPTPTIQGAAAGRALTLELGRRQDLGAALVHIPHLALPRLCDGGQHQAVRGGCAAAHKLKVQVLHLIRAAVSVCVGRDVVGEGMVCVGKERG
jgi:hypothetical protein